MHENRLVEVHDLRVEFPLEDHVVRAVNGISFHIDKGETLALVGESGSGKSVTAMALLRLNDNAGAVMPSGEIRFRQPHGEVIDVTKTSLERLQELRGKDISMIFQEPMTSLNPVFTVGYQIMEAVILHQNKTPEAARTLALEMLQQVRIPEPERMLNRYPHHLSGGMRQRAMIAMALSCRPSLLIADEPTTALDVTIQAQILDLIKYLQDEIGMSVLFITHDMGVVAEVADRVAVMLKGELVEDGAAETIFKRPQHPYTRTLLNAVPCLGSMRGKSAPEKFPEVTLNDTFDTLVRS